MDERTIKELAMQLGLSPEKTPSSEVIRKLEHKSDAELTAEILRLKEKLKGNNISYEKQMSMLNSLMPMMDANQKARLQKIIELLKR